MPLTQDEFETAVKASCPHCAAGFAARYRDDTKEFVHDFTARGSFSHTFCLASGLRKAYDQGQIEGKNG